MSANPAHIDLNSDVVSYDLENEVSGAKGSGAETLTESSKGQGQGQDQGKVEGSSMGRVVDEVGNFTGANDSLEGACGSDIGGFDRNVVLDAKEEDGGIEGAECSVEDGVVVGEAEDDGEPVLESKCGVGNVGAIFGDSGSNEKNGGEDESVKEVSEGKDMGATDRDSLVTFGAAGNVGRDGGDNPKLNGKEEEATQVAGGRDQNEQRVHAEEISGIGQLQDADASGWIQPHSESVSQLPAGIPGDGDENVKSAVSKLEFRVSDLVWGKVRSHPWWPGQICDPSASSNKAKKYFRKDGYLIAYFGDQTFAWNDASRIKPFRAHFSQMEKQSTTEDFRYAVDCALEEVSRRVEFGLACSCLSEEVYAKLKTQIIVNAGIREESSRREGGDSCLNATSLEPMELLEYVKALAQLPYGGADRLELVTTLAELLAFYRWKGYSRLPEFNMLGGLLESDEEIQLIGEAKNHGEVNNGSVSSGKGKSKSRASSSHKRKNTFGDGMNPGKKKKSLPDLPTEKGLLTPNGENVSGRKAVRKSISQSSGKKRKAADAMSDDSAGKHGRSPLSTGAADETIQTRKTFSVGDSIRRAANQMSGSSPILKYGDGMSQESEVTNKNKQKPILEFSSPQDMLSQLCLTAIDPMKGYSFLSVGSFFLEFRNSVSMNDPILKGYEPSLKQAFGGRTGKKSTKAGRKSTKPGITEMYMLERMNDSYWTDRIVQSIPDEQLSLENQNETSDKRFPTVEPQAALEGCLNLDPKQQSSGENLESDEAVKPVDHLEESCEQDLSPTALILNFTDLNSVPSEANLIKIFSRFGPLHESETEVLKKSSRAKVVFERRSDAEAAFSSAGKYSIFGPSLVSYRLKYLPSTPSKASPGATKPGTKDTP
ncbi:PWWP domain-containing protein 5-like [Corylus avellana]|uniref:PWWP domain-containing protein 5-like n=1 Tax=Corylus avellana TaxID=13451 RepID=UPI00286B2A75|nr:PWWP domain-containing protein 5-like [Corylus avellana]